MSRLLQRRSALETLSAFEVSRPTFAMASFESFVREGYRKNPVVYRCVETWASMVSAAVFQAVVARRERVDPLPDIDWLSLLLERPCVDYGSQTRAIKMIVRRLLLSGECPLYKVRGSRNGEITELQFLDPTRLLVNTDTTGRITGYQYTSGSDKKPIKLEELIFLKFDDPLSPRGLAPLAPAAMETETDNELTIYRKTFLENSGVLAGILTTEKDVHRDKRREWAREWAQNFGGLGGRASRKAGKTGVLSGGLKYESIAARPKDFGLADTSAMSESRICVGFGVPPILVGVKVGLDRSTFSNAKEARAWFAEEMVSPLIDWLADELTAGLTVRGDGRKVTAGKSQIEALTDNANERATAALEAFNAGAITLDAYLVETGRAPLPEGKGSYYLRPNNLMVVFADEVKAQERATVPALVRGETRTAYMDDDEIARLEEKLRVRIAGVFGTQAEEIVARLREVKSMEEMAVLAAGSMLHIMTEAARLAELTAPLRREILEVAAALEASSLGIAFGKDAPQIDDFVETSGLKFAVPVSETTDEAIRAAIRKGIAEGLTIPEIADLVDVEINNPMRSELIALTETARASNAGAMECYRQAGIEKARWITARGPRVCEFCKALEGREWLVGQNLFVPGDTIESEGGNTMTISDHSDIPYPPLHPRCQCTITAV